jgi:hypothetical protein
MDDTLKNALTRRTGRITRWVWAIVVAAMVGSLVVTGRLGMPHAVAAVLPQSASIPIRAAFYYPWYPETEEWATQYTPSLGTYSSDDPRVLATHVAEAKYARLDALISSYWGIGTKTAARLPLLLAAARGQGFHIASYYEPMSKVRPLTALQRDFDYLANLAADPAWLTVAGKPVLFVYNTQTAASCAGVRRILQASAGRFYVNAKVFSGYRRCQVQPDSWHQYAPAAAYDQQDAFSASVSPGFYKFDEETPRLARDLTRFHSDLARQVASGTQWQLVTSFNEWGEGSGVEPAVEWQSADGMGTYLTAMREVYGGDAPSSTPRTEPPSVTPTPSIATPPTRKVTKIITFVVENHSLAQMQQGMPYTYGLAERYGYATNWLAIRHPSLPNYLALAGGSTAGVSDDADPQFHPVAGQSVFGAALAAGQTAKSYQEGMATNCQAKPAGGYAPKHNPWAYYTDERSACEAFDVPAGTPSNGALHSDVATGSLPTVAEVTPDLCNDAHDCSLATADNWLQTWLTQIFAGPDWQSGELAIVITADEDDGSHGNSVLTVVVHPSQDHAVISSGLTHYSWTRMMTDLVGAPCLNYGCPAASMSVAFGLPL